jgi:hypothetical protein
MAACVPRSYERFMVGTTKYGEILLNPFRITYVRSKREDSPMNRIDQLKRLFGIRGRERITDQLVNPVRATTISSAEQLPHCLPLNIGAKSDLPGNKMQFGFSFQDVPGLLLSECRLVELEDCQVEMRLDEWDSVYFSVKQQGKYNVAFRGAGIPPALSSNARKQVFVEWNRAALPLEIWSGNYGHWLAYHLPKIAAFAENGWQDDVVLPVRGRWSQVETRDTSYFNLIAPNASGHYKLQPGFTNISSLAIIEGDPHHESLIGTAVRRILCSITPSRNDSKKRLFISRANAGYRKLVNEAELQSRLEEIGFEAVRLEDLALVEQINAFANAEFVVGMHGSGLANMIFCPKDAIILEVIADDFPCPDFYRLAVTMKLGYCLAMAESVGAAAPGYRDMRAPVDEIVSLVAELLQ